MTNSSGGSGKGCFEYHPRWMDIIELFKEGDISALEEAARILEDKERALEQFLMTKVCNAVPPTPGGSGNADMHSYAFANSPAGGPTANYFSTDTISPGNSVTTNVVSLGGAACSNGSVVAQAICSTYGATTGSVSMGVLFSGGATGMFGTGDVQHVIDSAVSGDPAQDFALHASYARDESFAGYGGTPPAVTGRIRIYNGTDVDIYIGTSAFPPLYFYDDSAASISGTWLVDPA